MSASNRYLAARKRSPRPLKSLDPAGKPACVTSPAQIVSLQKLQRQLEERGAPARAVVGELTLGQPGSLAVLRGDPSDC